MEKEAFDATRIPGAVRLVIEPLKSGAATNGKEKE